MCFAKLYTGDTMKKLLSLILCFAVLSALFGCSAPKSEADFEATEKAISNNSSDASIVFFETENDADCALIRYKGIHILIDTGEKDDGKKLAKYLNNKGITAVDYVIFSHFDKDHCGGALKLFDKIRVKEILHPEFIKDSDETEKLFNLVDEYQITDTVVSEKQTISLDGLSLTFFPANYQNYPEKESNNSSMVVMAEMMGAKVLFTGDCQEARVNELLNSNDDFSANILKLMYHGREINNEDALLDRIHPRYTVITGDRDKKKTKENIDRIADKLGEYYYACDGNITFEITENGISVNQ